MFGALNSQPAQQSSSLFGNSLTQNKPNLFGQSTTQTGQQPSLFGSLNQNNTQQQSQPQQATAPSLFGNLNKPATTNTSSLFGQTQPQQNAAPTTMKGSMFSSIGQPVQNTSTFGASLLGTSISQPQPQLQQSQLTARLAETLRPREKSIPDQIDTLVRKWSPESNACAMQSYFYTTVPPGTAPFWSPGPEDDEARWEEALSKKPSENSVPVLARGFQQLGLRLKLQVQAVQQLQWRLHEMNSSLEAMMQNHELRLSVRASEAKRKHVALGQKCIGLAIKVQVLRSKGFVMDSTEQDLGRKLETLEKAVFEPGLASREEEIWARMVALRERTAWITRESEKLGRQVGSGEKTGISEEVLKKVKQILSDYDTQITHLTKELEAVNLEYKQWQTMSGS